MVATTPEPCINLESLFDFNDNNNHGFKFIVDGNNHGFRFIIIVECYVSNGKPHRTLCCQNLPLHFFAFACVGEVDGDIDFVASSDGEGGVEV